MKTLKKIAVVLAAVLIFAGSADAKILRFGVKAGANFNKLSFSKKIGDDLINKSNSTGWEAGVMAETNVPLFGFGLDLSLMYARMNNNSEIYQNGVPIYDASKNFLMVPLNIKYKVSLPVVGKYISPYIFTGPNFLFNLDKNTIQDLQNKTCQVAWNFGLGVELINHLQIGASYNLGMGKVGKALLNIKTNEPEYTVKNNYWMVTAAYLF